MFLRKSFISSLTLCLLLSAAISNSSLKAYFFKTPPKSSSLLLKSSAGVGLFALTYLALIWYANNVFDNAEDQLNLLQDFVQDNNYNQLKGRALKLYSNTWFSSATSINSVYPVAWLETEADSNKKFLWWMKFITPITEKREKIYDLLPELNAALINLNKNEDFSREKKEFYNLCLKARKTKPHYVHVHWQK